MQAVVLKIKLGHIDDWNKARNSHALKYNDLLGGVPQIKCPKLRPDTFHIFHPLRHPGRAQGRSGRLPQDEGGSHGYSLPVRPPPDASLSLSEAPAVRLPSRLRVPGPDPVATHVSGAFGRANSRMSLIPLQNSTRNDGIA